MLKEVAEEDIAFVKGKYELDQALSFLPVSFKEEADLCMTQMDDTITNETCSRIYEELVAHFSQ